MSSADLRGADLRGADLRHANLTDANLNGVLLGKAQVHVEDWFEEQSDWRELTGERKETLRRNLDQ